MTGLRILIAAGASVALATGALAQSAAGTGNADVRDPGAVVSADRGTAGEAPTVNERDVVEIDDDFVVAAFNVPVDVLDDYDVYDRNGEYVGEVEEVIGTDAQTATAIVVEFDGPGWFDDDVERVVDISEFTIENDRLVIDMTADDARMLPVYKD